MEPIAPSGSCGRIEYRDPTPTEVARCLRAVLGLPVDEPAPGELAASIGRPPLGQVERLDAGAWVAWCLAGLRLFSGHQAGVLPDIRRLKAAAVRVLIITAMLRSKGNISMASRVIGSSRTVLRGKLRLLDLYPWCPVPKDEQDHPEAVR